MRTEQTIRFTSMGANALASSIVLVCRARHVDAPRTNRGGFIGALSRELPAALQKLKAGGIAPVDLGQAAIGPGMAVFSRYSAVLEPGDTPMSVRTALQLINKHLDEILSDTEGDFDADTRWALTWFESHGLKEGPYGQAETLSTRFAVAVDGLRRAGIVESGGGKVRLLSRDELPANWDPRTDTRLTTWEVTQHLVRALLKDGEDAAAAFLAAAGSAADPARDLAYRLFALCERKGWAQEAGPYNALAVAWPRLVQIAASLPAAPQQGTLV
jgi:putative DNA methylase